jgi:hypothetical protein
MLFSGAYNPENTIAVGLGRSKQPVEKIDLKKQFAGLYNPPKTPVMVEIPQFNFIMVDGKGDPNTSEEYQNAMQVLYSLSYTLKFMAKPALKKDYTVMALEGLWWAENMDDFLEGNKSNWHWTAMIMQPDFITREHYEVALSEVKKKKPNPSLEKARFEAFREGRSAQIMHIGPYSAERPTVAALHEFIDKNGMKPRGKHHEIYLGDPRKADPAKLKTVIRQAVEKA